MGKANYEKIEDKQLETVSQAVNQKKEEKEEENEVYISINDDFDETDSVRVVEGLNLEQKAVLFLAGMFYNFDPKKSDKNLTNGYFAYLKNNIKKDDLELSPEELQAIKEIDRIRLGYKVALGVASAFALVGLIFMGLVVLDEIVSDHGPSEMKLSAFNPS